MKRTRFTETQIVSILKEADAGTKVKGSCRQHGISDATFYNWKSRYSGILRRQILVRDTFPTLNQSANTLRIRRSFCKTRGADVLSNYFPSIRL